MRYYTYKVTFKDLPGYFYYGRHKDSGKPYLGRPVTWKHLWSLFEPEVQILQWYETEEEVRGAEESIIGATWKDKYSLNENLGGHISEDVCRKNGKANMTPDRAREFGKANGKKNGKKNGKANTSQRWQCLSTGFVSSPGGLSTYQKAKGIDTSMRVRLEG